MAQPLGIAPSYKHPVPLMIYISTTKLYSITTIGTVPRLLHPLYDFAECLKLPFHRFHISRHLPPDHILSLGEVLFPRLHLLAVTPSSFREVGVGQSGLLTSLAVAMLLLLLLLLLLRRPWGVYWCLLLTRLSVNTMQAVAECLKRMVWMRS